MSLNCPRPFPQAWNHAFGRAQFSARSESFIRKSADGGATWTRVYEDEGSNIRNLAAWGTYYPAQYTDADGFLHLVLRGSQGNGEWETLDDYVAGFGEAMYVNEVHRLRWSKESVYVLPLNIYTVGGWMTCETEHRLICVEQ